MQLFSFIIFIVLMTSCNAGSGNSFSTDSSFKTEAHQTSATNEKYTGTLPCADCEGIDVLLQLNNDSSYIMHSVYKGNRVDSNNHFNDTGKWSLYTSDTLYLSKNNQSIKYIKTDTTLTQLDGDGKIITGPLAKMFVLHKK